MIACGCEIIERWLDRSSIVVARMRCAMEGVPVRTLRLLFRGSGTLPQVAREDQDAVRHCEIRLQLQRMAVACLRIGEAAGLAERIAETAQRLGIARVDRQRRLAAGDCIFIAVEPLQGHGAV